MKVILKQDVKGTGKKGDILEVSDGYAQNFLLKKGLANPATVGSVNELKQKKDAAAFHKAEEAKACRELANNLKDKTVSVQIKSGENGKVFGSITSQNIATALAEMGFAVDKKKIVLDTPIKTLGVHVVEIRLMEGVSTKINVEVSAL